MPRSRSEYHASLSRAWGVLQKIRAILQAEADYSIPKPSRLSFEDEGEILIQELEKRISHHRYRLHQIQSCFEQGIVPYLTGKELDSGLFPRIRNVRMLLPEWELSESLEKRIFEILDRELKHPPPGEKIHACAPDSTRTETLSAPATPERG